jgi:hypothetical protein
VGLFGQWGAIQLLLAGLLWALVLRYRGLLPLVLLVLLLEPVLRALAGRLKPITTTRTAPGAKLNWRVVPVLGPCSICRFAAARRLERPGPGRWIEC